MEGGVVVKAAVYVVEEVFHRNRGFLAIQFQLNIPCGGGQQNMRVPFAASAAGETAERANTAATAASVDLSMRIP